MSAIDSSLRSQLALNISIGLSKSLFQYRASNSMSALEKKGKTKEVGLVAVARLCDLGIQMAFALSWVSNKNVPFLMLGVGGALSPIGQNLASNIASAVVKMVSSLPLSDSCQKFASCASARVQDGGAFALKHGDTLINTACAVSYAALIVIGRPVEGSLGLVGLALLACSRKFDLSSIVDPVVEKVFLIAGLVFWSTLPISRLAKLLPILSAGNKLFVSLSNDVKHKYPELLHPFHGLHKYENPSWSEMLDRTRNFELVSWIVNRTHIFTDELEHFSKKENDSEASLSDVRTNYRRAVHAILGQWRGNWIECVLLHEPSLIKEQDKNDLLPLFQAVFNHRYRTYERERYVQIKSQRSLLTASIDHYLSSQLSSSTQEKLGGIEAAIVLFRFATKVNPLQSLSFDLDRAFKRVNYNMNTYFDAANLVNHMYSAQKNKLEQGDGLSLSQELIESWVKTKDEANSSLNNSLGQHLAKVKDGTEETSIWFERDGESGVRLSKTGISLLLWDLGVILPGETV